MAETKIIADTVMAQNGVIEALGRDLAAPAGALEIDARGCTLLPGLIDAHTHVFPSNLEQALIFGVTTELDMFMDVRWMRELKQEQAEGKNLDRADLFSAGTIVTAPGGTRHRVQPADPDAHLTGGRTGVCERTPRGRFRLYQDRLRRRQRLRSSDS